MDESPPPAPPDLPLHKQRRVQIGAAIVALYLGFMAADLAREFVPFHVVEGGGMDFVVFSGGGQIYRCDEVFYQSSEPIDYSYCFPEDLECKKKKEEEAIEYGREIMRRKSERRKSEPQETPKKIERKYQPIECQKIGEFR